MQAWKSRGPGSVEFLAYIGPYIGSGLDLVCLGSANRLASENNRIGVG